jgi:hypothetical protein
MAKGQADEHAELNTVQKNDYAKVAEPQTGKTADSHPTQIGDSHYSQMGD